MKIKLPSKIITVCCVYISSETNSKSTVKFINVIEERLSETLKRYHRVSTKRMIDTRDFAAQIAYSDAKYVGGEIQHKKVYLK